MALYFAYGSTMDLEEVSRGIGERVTRPLFVASLADHSCIFTRSPRRDRDVVDIVHQPGRIAWGVVFEVSEEGMVRLDESVGTGLVPRVYRRITITVTAYTTDQRPVQTLAGVTIQDNAVVQAETYELNEKQTQPVPPSPRFILGVVASALRWRLPEDYIGRIATILSSDAFTVADIRIGVKDGTENVVRQIYAKVPPKYAVYQNQVAVNRPLGDDSDKRTHRLGVWNADIGKAPGAEDLGKGELLNSFGKKHDEAHHQANQDGPTFGAGAQQ
jgi:hypothetical protein